MLDYQLKPVSGLTNAEHERMFCLMKQHYDNTDLKRFQADLAAKTGVILLHDREQRLRGFSTYLIYRAAAPADQVVYSGDTIIEPDYWGSPCLFYGFGRVLKQVMDSLQANERAWWFLLSKGFRTFGLLPLFFKRFVPHLEESAAPDWQELRTVREWLARDKFGPAYDPATALVAAQADYLCGSLADIPETKAKHPWVTFFLQHNPDYVRGTELVCLTEIAVHNIKEPARRFVH